MTPMTITEIKQLDPEVFGVITRLWLDTGITNPARKDDLESVQYNLDHTGLILLAWDGEEAVGTVWLCHDYRRLYIHHMAVSPARQNQGIGRLLLQRSLEIATELGYQAKLEVHEENPAAIHLYSSLGFTALNGYTVMIKRQ